MLSSRVGFNPPVIGRLLTSVALDGVVSLEASALRARSIKIASSTSSQPTAATVRAAAPQVLDADGQISIASLTTITSEQTLYTSALAYETGAGAGSESPLAFAVRRVFRPPLRAADSAGKEAFDDLFILSTKTLKVGTVASPSVITKTLRVHHAEFVPAAQTSTWLYSNLQLQPGNLSLQTFWAPVVLPPGVTVTKLRMRAYRQTTGKIAESTLWKVASDTTSSLVTVTHDTTGWQTKEGTLSQLVGGEAYTIELSLSAQAGGAGVDARLQYVELEYTMPDYSKGV